MKFKNLLESISASIHAPWFFFDSVSFHWEWRSTAREGRTSSKVQSMRPSSRAHSSCPKGAAPGCRQASAS